MNLSIGAGMKRYADTVHLDRIQLPGIDVVWDLKNLPMPFKDAEFDNIIAEDIIEHIEDVIALMEDCWRILKLSGKINIRTTNWRYEQAYRDPTHRHFFTMESFDFFCPETEVWKKYSWYSTARFKKLEVREDGQELIFILEKQELMRLL